MTSFPKLANIKIEYNIPTSTFSDHNYCYKERAVDDSEMDEPNHSFFVDVENDDDQLNYNARGRKRRSTKQPDYFTFKNNAAAVTNSNVKRETKVKTTKNVGKRRRSAQKKDKFEVEYIWGKQEDPTRPGKIEYRVKWKGYPINESSWEPEESLQDCRATTDTYEQRAMYFNDLGEKEMREKAKGGMAGPVKVVVVNNRAKPLKKVLPTMHAPLSSSVSHRMSIPPLPKPQKRLHKKSSPPNKANKQSSKINNNSTVSNNIKCMPSHSPSPPASSSLDSQLTGAKKRKASAFFNGTTSAVSQSAFPVPNNCSSNTNKSGVFNVEKTAKTIEELAVKLQAKTVDEIISHEQCDIEGVPYLFTVRYGDASVKRVIMRDLLDLAPRLLAIYLVGALKRSEDND